MEIKTFGHIQNKKMLLIHGFESPYQIWEPYIEAFQNDYYIIVPILPGHNPKKEDSFISFEKCAKEIEDFLNGEIVEVCYAMSMGGVLGCILWQNNILHIKHLILESSPLVSYNNLMNTLLTKQYLMITKLAQKRNPIVVKQATQSMVTKEYLDVFLELLDYISDQTIIDYLNAVCHYKLPIDNSSIQLTYLHGTKIAEFYAFKTAKYLKKHYPHANIISLKGKAHCEDALLNPLKHIQLLKQTL